MQSEFVTALFSWIAAHPGWVSAVIFISSAAESLTIVGVIIPGALIMFSFGALIGLGHLDFWSAYWWSAFGAVVGDAISFWIGRVFHQGVRRVWPFAKHPEMLARSEEFFRKHGGKGVLFGRFFGPVRGTIPTVAGMMDMTWRNFMVANVVSAILWSPAYLIPGMVFGASLDIASRVAGRLVILILIIAVMLWATTWLVKWLVRLFQRYAPGWVRRFYNWSQDRRFVGPVAASLLDPTEGAVRGLATLAVLLLGSVVLVGLSLDAAGQQLPGGLDQSLYYFFQTLRTPWADAVMVFIAQLGSYWVTLPLSLVVLGWMIWQHRLTAAWYWLAALGFGMAINFLFRVLLTASGPVEISLGSPDYSFPSSHATFNILVFGFLAVLIARDVSPPRRWIVYLTAALLIVPIAFARLYLGMHWLSDTLAGLCLGLVWITLLGLAYNRHVTAVAIPWRRLLAYSVVTLLVADLFYLGLRYDADLQRFQPRPVVKIMSREQWLQEGWRQLPLQRLDFRGNRRQDFVLQWAGSAEGLIQRLQKAGWETAPPPNLRGILLWLSPQVQLRELPVLPQIHDGSEDDLRLVRYTEDGSSRWVLRFWGIPVRLRDGDTPMWIGSIGQQELEPHMKLFTLAVDVPQTRSPSDLLAPAWQGLTTKTVQSTNPHGHIVTLITEP